MLCPHCQAACHALPLRWRMTRAYMRKPRTQPLLPRRMPRRSVTVPALSEATNRPTRDSRRHHRRGMLNFGAASTGHALAKLGTSCTEIQNHKPPTLLKERYGGLENFLTGQSEFFIIGNNHQFNPRVQLRPRPDITKGSKCQAPRCQRRAPPKAVTGHGVRQKHRNLAQVGAGGSAVQGHVSMRDPRQ